MKKWIVEMPDGWEPYKLESCPFSGISCRTPVSNCGFYTEKGEDCCLGTAIPYEPVDCAKSSAPVESLALQAGKMGIGIEIVLYKDGRQIHESPFLNDTQARAYLESLPNHIDKDSDKK